MHRYHLLLLLLPFVFFPLSHQDEDRLRMCPPGGSSFTMAWSMACSMRKKREIAFNRGQRALWLAPSIRQLQSICCEVGCSITDLLSYCGPISAW